MNTKHKGSGDESTRKVALSERLEDFGWAALLIVIGTIWLMPENLMPKGSWLIAAGIIMLGLNAIRYFNGIKRVGFSLVAGILALLAGFGEYFGLTLPLFAIALIVIGLVMLIKRKRLTNTPVRMAGSVLKCPDDRKNRVVSAQATYASGGSAVGG